MIKKVIFLIVIFFYFFSSATLAICNKAFLKVAIQNKEITHNQNITQRQKRADFLKKNPYSFSSVKDVVALNNTYFKNLTPAQVDYIIDFNSKHWATSTYRAVGSMFIVKYIESLNGNQISTVNFKKLDILMVDDLLGFTKKIMDHFTNAQLKHVITVNNKYLLESPQIASFLVRFYIQRLNKTQISTLPFEFLSLLQVYSIKQLTIKQIQSFTYKQVYYLVHMLRKSFVANPKIASAFIKVYIETLTPDQVPTIDKIFLSLLNIRDLKQLPHKHMVAFTNQQLRTVLNIKETNIKGAFKHFYVSEYIAINKVDITLSSYIKRAENFVSSSFKHIKHQ